MNNTGQISKVRGALPFAQIPNAMLQDPSLSAKAKGLLAFLLSLPEDWVIYKSNLGNFFSDGYDSLISGWKELEAAGYVLSVRMIDANGMFKGWNHVVYYEPQLARLSSDSGISEIGKPEIGKIGSIQRKNLKKKDYTNKHSDPNLSPNAEVQTAPQGIVALAPPSEDAVKFSTWFETNLAPESVKKGLTKARRDNWASLYDWLTKKGYSKDQIAKACKWAREDEFWSQNFRSPMKLKDSDKDGVRYIDIFLEKSNRKAKVEPAAPKDSSDVPTAEFPRYSSKTGRYHRPLPQQ